ncbi:MAG: hypothetical protein ABMA64_38465 [Myxococcota bacterium]
MITLVGHWHVSAVAQQTQQTSEECGYLQQPISADGVLLVDTGAGHWGLDPQLCSMDQPLVDRTAEYLDCWVGDVPPTFEEFLLGTGWVRNPPPGATEPWFWYDATEVLDTWAAGACTDPPVDVVAWQVDLYDGTLYTAQFDPVTGLLSSYAMQAVYNSWSCEGELVDDLWWGEYQPVDLATCDLHDRDYWIEALGVEPAEPPPPSPGPAVAPEAGCGCSGQAPGAWWAVVLPCLLAIPRLRRGSSDDHAAAARV